VLIAGGKRIGKRVRQQIRIRLVSAFIVNWLFRFLGSDAVIIASMMSQRYLTNEYHTIALLLRSIRPYMPPLVDEITSLYKHVILVYYSIFRRLLNQVSKKNL
jgi:hypothetical protein